MPRAGLSQLGSYPICAWPCQSVRCRERADVHPCLCTGNFFPWLDNLQPVFYDHFVLYLTEVVRWYRDTHGITFRCEACQGACQGPPHPRTHPCLECLMASWSQVWCPLVSRLGARAPAEHTRGAGGVAAERWCGAAQEGR